VAWWFFAMDIQVLEGWGLTETAAPATMNTEVAYRVGTVGKPIPGVQVRIAPDGEVEVKGPGLFQGYFKKPEATDDAFTKDGWFRTGDIGSFDADGFLRITDRKKELIITAGGKNIGPVGIEKPIERCPGIMQAVAIGDDRPYLVALLAPDDEELPVLARQLELVGRPTAELLADPRAVEIFRRAVADANAELARFEQIKRFAILPRALSEEAGELTPTLKLKRRVVAKRYAAVIQSLYEGGGISTT
jgi:long-chain acyl-CoA synthetase